VSDRDGALEMVYAYAPNLSKVAKILCDGGYSGENFAYAVKAFIGAEVETVKRNELHTFAVILKRRVARLWVAGKGFWKNCERNIHNVPAVCGLSGRRRFSGPDKGFAQQRLWPAKCGCKEPWE
jgi:transposase